MYDNLQASLLSLFAFNPDACYVLDMHGNFVAVNDATATLTGFTKDELLQLSFHPLIVPEQMENVERTFRSIVSAGIKAEFEVEIFSKSSERLFISVTAMPVNINGQITGAIGMAKNLTKSKRLEQSLLSTQAQLKNIFDSIEVCLWSTNLLTREIQISPACETIYAQPQEKFIQNPELWMQVIHPEDQELVQKKQKALWSGKKINHEYRIVHPDGTIRYVHDYTVPVLNEAGELIRLDGVITDITERKKTDDRLHMLAFHDALTGLPNRRFIRETIRSAIAHADRHKKKAAIMYLDLDEFKFVNDSLGHSGGDQLLKRISKRIARCLKSGDHLARIGGDEFVILLEQTDEHEAERVARNILTAVTKPFHIAHQEFIVSTSIGISMCPEHGTSHELLFKRADQAMYLAKEKGKNQFQIFNQEISIKVERRLMLEQGLRKALQNEELVVYYQPIVNVVTGQIIGTESLIRWMHSSGLISPLDFIPIAEETGQIIQIGEWVLRKACAQNKLWQEQGQTDLFVSVNLSVQQLEQEHFIETLQGILEETALDPQYLHIEITESAAMRNVNKALTVLQALGDIGVSISIDDFGTGYSSLSYLEHFPIHTLKIDQTFIRSNQTAIIKAIVAMAKGLGINVIAEGIETERQLKQIHQIGCHQMQGFWFCAPVLPDQIAAFMNVNVK